MYPTRGTVLGDFWLVYDMGVSEVCERRGEPPFEEVGVQAARGGCAASVGVVFLRGERVAVASAGNK